MFSGHNSPRFLKKELGQEAKYRNDLLFAHNIHKIVAIIFPELNQVIDGFEDPLANLGIDYQTILNYVEETYTGSYNCFDGIS